MYDKNKLSPAEIDEIEREKQGLIYQDDAKGDSKVKVPVRKLSLEPL